MEPFSSNIIFWDSEFSNLDPYKGEILSIGMVKLTGEELYFEVAHDGEISPWVSVNVLPLLTEPKVSREEAIQKIISFVGAGSPFLVSYVTEFDTPFLYKLFGVNDLKRNKDLPFHWISLDFASMLFTRGIDPESFSVNHKDSLVKKLGIETTGYREHHALDDARLLREVYMKLVIQ